jgi:hypothetical protein
MIYELRLYSVTPGRITDVQNRYQHYLPKLFDRHGMACVGRWTATSGPKAPLFIYLMRYRDYANREECWASFSTDPEWWAVRAETNAGEEMIESFDLMFLKPSPAWEGGTNSPIQAAGGMHELIFQHVALGQSLATHNYLSEIHLPALTEVGAQVLGVFDVASGCNLPKVVTMLAWKDASARHAGWKAIASHQGLLAKVREQRKTVGCALLQRADVYTLEPAPYALPEAFLLAGNRDDV